MTTSPLADFLPYTVSQKSASLVLVDSEADAKKTLASLKQSGFQALPDIHILGTPGKYYLTAKDYAPSALYDLLVQYGSGQIFLHDKNTGAASWVNPAYAGSSLVLLMTKKALQKIEQGGVELRGSVGLALQI